MLLEIEDLKLKLKILFEFEHHIRICSVECADETNFMETKNYFHSSEFFMVVLS